MACAAAACGVPVGAQDIAGDLPRVGEATDLPEADVDPLAVDFSSDPILALADTAADPEQFRRIVASSLQANASRREADARVDLAEAQVDEAQAGNIPTVDLGITSYKTIARDFGNDPFNLLERSRPRERTDATAGVEYTVFDWGAVNGVILASQARLRAAGYERDAAVTGLVNDVVTSWYSVFAYQSLVRLAEGYLAAQDGIDEALDKRVAQGISAPADMARAASLRADGEIRLAQFQRRLASSEARFRELTGVTPPPLLQRPPLLEEGRISRDYAVMAASDTPEVKGAEALAQAARIEVRNSWARQAPKLTARVDAGRYGLLEGEEDYDVRGSLNLRYRLFGGALARDAQARARAAAAEATADRIQQEAERDAAVTWADVQALERQLVALEASYKSARQTRDVVFRRFSSLRGTLFDVADAQSAYLAASIAYIEGLTQLDASRYILLARTGRLLEQFEMEEGL
nr:TolC family protein [Qipengyuania proteolytica]